MVQASNNPGFRIPKTILAIDTSTEHAGLALGTADGIVTRSWAAGRTQTTSVLPVIDELVRESGVEPSGIEAIAVATGPGTFTGLRVGMSIAKGIVLAVGIPLVGIPTLEITAAGAAGVDDLIAVLPAGRGRVVWQRFGPGSPGAPQNATLEELIQELQAMPDVLVVGELAEPQQEQLSREHPNVRWAFRDPSQLVRLANNRLARGESDDPIALEPVYLHGVVVRSGPVQDRLKRTR